MNSNSVEQKITPPRSPEVIDLTGDDVNIFANKITIQQKNCSITVPPDFSPVNFNLPTTCSNSGTGDKNKELERLKHELKNARQRIAILEIELAKEKWMTRWKLSKASYKMNKQMKTAVEAAEQRQNELETGIIGKVIRLEESTANIGDELSELIKELQAHFQNSTTTSGSVKIWLKLLDKLSTLVENKFEKIREDQAATKMQLENMTKTVEKVMMLVNENKEKTLNVDTRPVSPTNNSAKTMHQEKSPGNVITSKSVEDGRDGKTKETVHALSESNKNVHVCTCGYRGSSKSNFTTHIRFATGEKRFKCCGKGFLFLSQLKQHMKNKHKISTKCTRPRPATSNNALLGGERISDEKHPSSPVENFTSHNSKAERIKSKIMHGLNRKKRQEGYFCLCGKKFTSMACINKHLDRHRFAKSKITVSQRIIRSRGKRQKVQNRLNKKHETVHAEKLSLIKIHFDNTCITRTYKSELQVENKGQGKSVVEDEDYPPNPLPIATSDMGEPVTAAAFSSTSSAFTLLEPPVVLSAASAIVMPNVEQRMDVVASCELGDQMALIAAKVLGK